MVKNKRKEKPGMKKENLSKKSAVIVTAALDKVLNVEANTTSCYFAYQPKAPKELKQFRRDK